MKERWWSDPVTTERYLGKVDSSDAGQGVAVVLLGLHSAGSSVLRGLSGRTCVELEDVGVALGSVSTDQVESAYRRATGGTTDDSKRWVDARKGTADQAALRLVNALMTAKVPMPNALSRAAGVYGVDSEMALKFAGKNKLPNMPPVVLNDAADRALISFVADQLSRPQDSVVSKATVYEMHERDGRMVQLEVARDESGKFSSKSGSGTERKRETPDEEHRRVQKEERAKKRDKRLKTLRTVRTVRTAATARNATRVGQLSRDAAGERDAASERKTSRAVRAAALKGRANLKLSETGASRERATVRGRRAALRHGEADKLRERGKPKPPWDPSSVTEITAADVLAFDLGRGALDNVSGDYAPYVSDVSAGDKTLHSVYMNVSMANAIRAAEAQRNGDRKTKVGVGSTAGMIVPDNPWVSTRTLFLANNLRGATSNAAKTKFVFGLDRPGDPGRAVDATLGVRLKGLSTGNMSIVVITRDDRNGNPDEARLIDLSALASAVEGQLVLKQLYSDAMVYAKDNNMGHPEVTLGFDKLLSRLETMSSNPLYPPEGGRPLLELANDLGLAPPVFGILTGMRTPLFVEDRARPGTYGLSGRYKDLYEGASKVHIESHSTDAMVAPSLRPNPGRQLFEAEIESLEDNKSVELRRSAPVAPKQRGTVITTAETLIRQGLPAD